MLDRIADGRTDLVFDFLGGGGAADAKDPHDVPLIQWCAYYGDVSAIKHLLRHGEALDSLGHNLDLNGACFHGHWCLCEFLLEQGADVNDRAADTGETGLHSALCKPGVPDFDLVLEVLLAHGAEPNVATEPGVETGAFMRDCRTKGETPLHRAAAFGSERAIRMLLDAGARVDAQDRNGDTPLSWASWYARPLHITSKLTYGPHRIHPAAVASSMADRDAGWRGMEKSLAGKPRGATKD